MVEFVNLNLVLPLIPSATIVFIPNPILSLAIPDSLFHSRHAASLNWIVIPLFFSVLLNSLELFHGSSVDDSVFENIFKSIANILSKAPFNWSYCETLK